MTRADKSKMTPGQKAAHTRKWRRASTLAHARARNAKTFTKYFLQKRGYRCISLDSRKGYEYKGVVDMVAIRRDKKNPDRLQIVLVQVKGGKARVTADELERLRAATKLIKVHWNVAEKPSTTIRLRNKI
ncbi:MAG TPA: hypothetical protein ACFYED_08740 [Candidatus Tripitaka californicus]